MSENQPKPYAARRPTLSAPVGGHLPPQALDLEAAVLGAALLEADSQRTLLAILPTEEVFYCTAHRKYPAQDSLEGRCRGTAFSRH